MPMPHGFQFMEKREMMEKNVCSIPSNQRKLVFGLTKVEMQILEINMTKQLPGVYFRFCVCRYSES